MKKLLSAITPSNKVTLGNYLGALKYFVDLYKDYETYIFVSDLHVLTNPRLNHKEFLESKKMIVCLYAACGMDLEKAHVFFQSDVPAHTELEHVLMCNTNMGELSRMTQYKDKKTKFISANGTEQIPCGLFTYPVLMAADILLYDIDIVPVGSDQKQHMELTKILAERMNNKFGKLVTIPEAYIPKVGARIMDLQNPEKKMSKSNESEKGTIFMLEPVDSVRKKIMSAKTDSLNQVKFNPDKQPGIANLMIIYEAITNLSIKDIEHKFKDQNYGVFKKDLADQLFNLLQHIQTKYKAAAKDYETKILPIIKKNAILANKIANKKLEKVYQAVGLRK